jgi:hypothetical protein
MKEYGANLLIQARVISNSLMPNKKKIKEILLTALKAIIEKKLRFSCKDLIEKKLGVGNIQFFLRFFTKTGL